MRLIIINNAPLKSKCKSRSKGPRLNSSLFWLIPCLFVTLQPHAQDSAATQTTALEVHATAGLTRVQKTPTVAVLEFTAPGGALSPEELQTMSSRFENEILVSDSFRVVERRNIARILREQGFQQSGACDNSECQVEVGQLLGVQSLFTGEVAQLDGAWTLSVKRTDVGSGQTVFSHVLDIRGGKATLQRDGVVKMARIATRLETPENEHSVLVAERPIWPWVVGGAVIAGAAVTTAILLMDNSTKENSTSAPSTNYNTELQWKTQP